MLDKNESFNADLYNKDTKPRSVSSYAPRNTEGVAIRCLETLGYQIPDKSKNV